MFFLGYRLWDLQNATTLGPSQFRSPPYPFLWPASFIYFCFLPGLCRRMSLRHLRLLEEALNYPPKEMG